MCFIHLKSFECQLTNATAKDMGIKRTGTFRPCEGCPTSKDLRTPIAKSTSCRLFATLGRLCSFQQNDRDCRS